MAKQITVCPVADLPPGAVTGAGPYAIGNIDGKYFAVTRRCRHLRADLAGGSIEDGRLAASSPLSWAFETLRADKIPGV